MSLIALLTQSVTIQSLSTSQSDLGGTVKTYANRLTGVRALGRVRNSDENDEFGKETQRVQWRWYVEGTPDNQTIDNTDRLIFDSRTFEIRSVYNVANRGVLIHIEAEEIEI